jgi:hypothetical protein
MTAQQQQIKTDIEFEGEALAPHHAQALARMPAASGLGSSILQYAISIALPLLLGIIGAHPTLYTRYQEWHSGQGDPVFNSGPLVRGLKIAGVRTSLGISLTRT